MTSGPESLPVDRVHALEDLLEMYHFKDEDVLLCEAFANAVDVFLRDHIKNPKIEITLEQTDSNTSYINFHNNGTPMSNKEFKKYHIIAGSYKKKGGGIGFAGVGAKVFLVSQLGGEIFTITGKNSSDFLASRMFRTTDDVKYEIITDLSKIPSNNKFQHKHGTTYRVRLNMKGYKYFKNELISTIQFWWNFALLKKQFTVVIDGKKIEPLDFKERFNESFKWKNHEINCYCWISNDNIQEKIRHIVYSVHGKRIMNENILQPINLKNNYFEKICCLVDVSHIAKHIRTDKESFASNWETNQTKNEVQKFFVGFLAKHELIGRDYSKPSTTEIVNDMTKELDRLLQTKEFKDLNPFLPPRRRLTLVPNKNGDVPLNHTEGDENTLNDDSKNEGNKLDDLDHGNGKSVMEDSDGKKPGKRIHKKSKGISIIPTDEYPDEPEESWVDPHRGAVCINICHPFYIKMRESDTRFGKFERFNIVRLLIEALIKFKNDELKDDWDPRKTINTYRDLLHRTWTG